MSDTSTSSHADPTAQRRTGWPPGMLQDDSRELSRWLANRLDAMRIAREAARKIEHARAKPASIGVQA